MTTTKSRLLDMAQYLGGWPAPVGLLLIIGLHFSTGLPYQDVLRTLSFDLYQMAYPRERVSAPVTIVDIDEESLRQYGQWPWPRTLLARMLDRLWDTKPAAVAFDIIMPEADRSSPCQVTQDIPHIDHALVHRLCQLPSNDSVLAKSLARGKSVLGIAGIEGGTAMPIHAAPMRTLGADPLPHLRSFSTGLTNVAELENATPGHAILSTDVERGIVRRVPLAAAIGDTVLPSLSIEMLRVASGSPGFMGRKRDLSGRALTVGMLTGHSEGEVSRMDRIGNAARDFVVTGLGVAPSILENTFVREMDQWHTRLIRRESHWLR